MLLRYTVPLLLGAAAALATHSNWVGPPAYTKVTWTSPTEEPQRNTKGQPIIGGGMPVGNGETALLVFPLAPHGSVSPPPPSPPGPPACKTTSLVDGYCDVGKFIGCHDSSCQFPSGRVPCNATTHTKEACALEGAKRCDEKAGCVAFSMLLLQDSFAFEFAHNNPSVLLGKYA